ncbi:MAG: hypothetical protein KUG81_00810 [Gammaproteobacteria bacterium]|nr:hypothetical protein [Gammaproteobacteria bacterium]
MPKAIVYDGGYASKSNVEKGRGMAVKSVVSHTAMGVQIKTFKKLRNFRASVDREYF